MSDRAILLTVKAVVYGITAGMTAAGLLTLPDLGGLWLIVCAQLPMRGLWRTPW